MKTTPRAATRRAVALRIFSRLSLRKRPLFCPRSQVATHRAVGCAHVELALRLVDWELADFDGAARRRFVEGVARALGLPATSGDGLAAAARVRIKAIAGGSVVVVAAVYGVFLLRLMRSRRFPRASRI